MPELGASYDSSFHDTDPFDAQPGGCCSILPYFLGDLVELPITLPHDFTLFELLREPDIRIWREKASWIAAHGGLVNVLVHPDYARTPERLRLYEDLLEFLAALEGGWHALPRDVAAWWRRRSARAARSPAGGRRRGAGPDRRPAIGGRGATRPDPDNRPVRGSMPTPEIDAGGPHVHLLGDAAAALAAGGRLVASSGARRHRRRDSCPPSRTTRLRRC